MCYAKNFFFLLNSVVCGTHRVFSGNASRCQSAINKCKLLLLIERTKWKTFRIEWKFLNNWHKSLSLATEFVSRDYDNRSRPDNQTRPSDTENRIPLRKARKSRKRNFSNRKRNFFPPRKFVGLESHARKFEFCTRSGSSPVLLSSFISCKQQFQPETNAHCHFAFALCNQSQSIRSVAILTKGKFLTEKFLYSHFLAGFSCENIRDTLCSRSGFNQLQTEVENSILLHNHLEYSLSLITILRKLIQKIPPQKSRRQNFLNFEPNHDVIWSIFTTLKNSRNGPETFAASRLSCLPRSGSMGAEGAWLSALLKQPPVACQTASLAMEIS